MPPARAHRLWLQLLFFLSGAAALGYQMVWARMFAAGLGHETPAVMAVVGAFLGGLALGGWCGDRPISRSQAKERWYGGLELLIGAWGAATALLIPAVNRLALDITGPQPSALQQWFVVFLLPWLVLLPATAAMGATFPAMDRLLGARIPGQRCLGAVYAANTFGGVAGSLAGVFLLMPALGFRTSLLCLAGLNFFCGLTVLLLPRPAEAPAKPGRHSTMEVRAPRRSQPTNPSAAGSAGLSAASFGRIALIAGGTGLLGIGFELVGLRLLLQVLENTLYTYAAILAVYLLGTASGAALYQKFGRDAPFARVLTYLLCGTATACLLGNLLLRLAQPFYDRCRHFFGDSLVGVLFSEMAVASLVFGLPTVLMGATFSHLVQHARADHGGVGRATAVNTLGCSLATVLVGALLLPALGTKWSMIALSSGYLLLIPQNPRRVCWWILLITALGFAVPSPWEILSPPPGTKLRAYREGIMASVAVYEEGEKFRTLRVNNRLQMGGTAAALAERREAHLPLLLHPSPRRALFLGPGTGITLGAAGTHPGLVADGVELVPEILELMSYFEPENEGPLPKPGIRLQAADARRFVRTTTNRYDVIVADLFHPAQDGAGFLYTREHFAAVRRCLSEGGLFCQWLPLHQMDQTVLRSIIRTYLEVFPEACALLLHFNVDIPVLGLVGGSNRLRISATWAEHRVEEDLLREQLRRVGLDRALNVLGCFAAGPEALRQFAGNARISTDDLPLVLFAAPRFTIRRDAKPYELLMGFLRQTAADPQQVAAAVMEEGNAALVTELSQFMAARDLYLKGLVQESAGQLPEAIDSYLASAAASVYFTPGYARCVKIIQVMAPADRPRARKLFERLEQAQPKQPLARKLLGPLFEDAGEANAKP